MNKVTIVSVVYHEPEWKETQKCIEACGVPVVYVERAPAGVGSLAEAINRGFKLAPESEYVWFITNVTFDPDVLKSLVGILDGDNMIAGVHPTFNSDHEHLQTNEKLAGSYAFVPFIEFTAALIRRSIFENHLLDEKMPYVGHDMAWGFDMRSAGYLIAVDHDSQVGHTYIRHRKGFHPITQRRKALRSKAVPATIQRLIELYGPDYRTKIQYGRRL